MDPPRAPASEPNQFNAILNQLNQINTLLAAQHRRLEALEQINAGPNINLTSGAPSRVGEEGQDARASSGGRPAESEGEMTPVQHETGLVLFEYCPTLKMVADSLTKGVPKAKTEFCQSAMGVMDLAPM